MMRTWLGLGFVPLFAALTACGGDDEVDSDGSSTEETGGAGGAGGAPAEVPETVPDFDANDFSDSASIDHPYFPLSVGHTLVYFGETEDGTETTVVEVLDQTRAVFGVTTRVVLDRVFADGLLMENTYDWFAQDDSGNVWYMGEETESYDH